MLDALMLVARLPRSACIMKASLMRNPFLAPGARLARYIRNDSPRGLVRLAVDDLRQGGQLVMFPEGTRTTLPAGEPASSAGVTLIAQRAQAPIQTVFIDTSSPYLCKGWPLWRLPPLPIVFSVRLGRRFEPADQPAALLAEIEAYFAAGVRPACRMTTPASTTHLVLIPSYNTGATGLRHGACGARAVEPGVGGGRRQQRRHRRRPAGDGRRTTPACRSSCCRRTRARAPPCCTGCSRRPPPASRMR